MTIPCVRLIDNHFGHATSCCNGNLGILPKYSTWDRTDTPRHATFFTGGAWTDPKIFDRLHGANDYGIKVWWITEPPVLIPTVYPMAEDPKICALFDYILTYDKRLLKNGGKYLFCPSGGSWIPEGVDLSRPKTKRLSMIASDKRGHVGYELRYEIAEALHPHMELFGQIISKPIHCKTEGLIPFKFSVVVENDKLDDYFTEKLIDCLTCGTIPFYWGTTNIERFDADGIIPFDSIEDLRIKIDLYGHDAYYEENRASVLNNIRTAKQYRVTEDWIFTHYPFLFA